MVVIKSNILHLDKVKAIWEPELITDKVLHRLLLIMDKEHLQVMVKVIQEQQLIRPQQLMDMVKEEVQDMAKEEIQDMAKEEIQDMEKEDNQVIWERVKISEQIMSKDNLNHKEHLLTTEIEILPCITKMLKLLLKIFMKEEKFQKEQENLD